MSESSNVPSLTESSTVQQIYEHCTSYAALLKHPHRPRLGVITDLINCIRTYKSQHNLPTLDAAYEAHRQYVFHPPPGKRKRLTTDEGAGFTKRIAVTEPSTAPSPSPPAQYQQRNELESKHQKRLDDIESKYTALESRYEALESKYQQRIEGLEQQVKQIQWQPDNRLPRRINCNFTILSELGMGPRAIVYKCINRSNNTQVALKVSQDPRESNVVRNDALIIHRIGWPYLIRFHGSSESLHNPNRMKHVDAIEMKLFQCTLRSNLQALDSGKRPQCTPRSCLQRFAGLLEELETWHAQGVVHCDIKPDNVIWSEDEQRYVLIDFGHAVSADDHMVVQRGTTTYSAPEALGCWVQTTPQDQQLATRGDVWSLGLTLMYVCCRKPRRALFSVADCRDEGEKRTKVSNAIRQYLARRSEDRMKWLSQQLQIDEPEIMSSMVDLLSTMICEPETRWEMADVRSHKLWSLV
jgi:serine/threonine protein kinase